jgi:hypothetical protein
MGKKDKGKKKGKGAEKTATKTDKKLSQKQKKELAATGEVYYNFQCIVFKTLFTIFIKVLLIITSYKVTICQENGAECNHIIVKR